MTNQTSIQVGRWGRDLVVRRVRCDAFLGSNVYINQPFYQSKMVPSSTRCRVGYLLIQHGWSYVEPQGRSRSSPAANGRRCRLCGLCETKGGMASVVTRHGHGSELLLRLADWPPGDALWGSLRPVDGWALNGFVSMLTDHHMGLWSVGAC